MPVGLDATFLSSLNQFPTSVSGIKKALTQRSKIHLTVPIRYHLKSYNLKIISFFPFDYSVSKFEHSFHMKCCLRLFALRDMIRCLGKSLHFQPLRVLSNLFVFKNHTFVNFAGRQNYTDKV